MTDHYWLTGFQVYFTFFILFFVLLHVVSRTISGTVHYAIVRQTVKLGSVDEFNYTDFVKRATDVESVFHAEI